MHRSPGRPPGLLAPAEAIDQPLIGDEEDPAFDLSPRVLPGVSPEVLVGDFEHLAHGVHAEVGMAVGEPRYGVQTAGVELLIDRPVVGVGEHAVLDDERDGISPRLPNGDEGSHRAKGYARRNVKLALRSADLAHGGQGSNHLA